MPFLEAARSSRRVLLLGDLGTGKSTLAAVLVLHALEGLRAVSRASYGQNCCACSPR